MPGPLDGTIVLVLSDDDDKRAVWEALVEQSKQLERQRDSYPLHESLIVDRLNSLGRCLQVMEQTQVSEPPDEPTYRVVRKYGPALGGPEDELVLEGVSLAEAQAHCSSKESAGQKVVDGELWEWMDVFYREG
jgi:hypothetical protein